MYLFQIDITIRPSVDDERTRSDAGSADFPPIVAIDGLAVYCLKFTASIHCKPSPICYSYSQVWYIVVLSFVLTTFCSFLYLCVSACV